MKNKGFTLVDVIVSFAILLVCIAAFYTSVRLSQSIMISQQSQRDNAEALITRYYKKERNGSCNNSSFAVSNDKDGLASSIHLQTCIISDPDKGELHYYE